MKNKKEEKIKRKIVLKLIFYTIFIIIISSNAKSKKYRKNYSIYFLIIINISYAFALLERKKIFMLES